MVILTKTDISGFGIFQSFGGFQYKIIIFYVFFMLTAIVGYLGLSPQGVQAFFIHDKGAPLPSVLIFFFIICILLRM